MKKAVREGQSFFSFLLGNSPAGVATGEVSPYEPMENWGNGNDRETQKELGQVATPSEIARIMGKWITAEKPRTILDPAAGLGNLLFEAHRLCPSAQLIGIEHDASTHTQALRAAPPGTQLLLADYLKCHVERVDAVIVNPPYVKAHYLQYTEADWRFFDEAFGLQLDRSTNLYALFLLKIWEDLGPNGRAAVIIPSEFLNANFGVPIKRRLLQSIRPAGIAVFNSRFSVFDNALTTSCILFIQKGREKHWPILAHEVGSIRETEEFADCLLSSSNKRKTSKNYADISGWDPADKWLNRIFGVRTEGLDKMPEKIGDYFRCLRGIATGANDYFALSRHEIDTRGMRLSDFSPCITHATDAHGLLFTSTHFSKMEQSGKRCYLLDPKEVNTHLQPYLDVGVKRGVSERHLPSHRPVWYMPETRAPADIWIAVFSREYLKCILNAARIKNLTCYHGMYIKTPRQGHAELMTLFLNSRFGKTAFHQVNRFYGNGLNKLEPKDVEAMPCPVLPEITIEKAKEVRETMLELEPYSAIERLKKTDALVRDLLGLK